MKKDRAKAWEDYCRLCRAGGSLGYFQLLQLAGLRSPFEPGSVAQSVAGVLDVYKRQTQNFALLNTPGDIAHRSDSAALGRELRTQIFDF